jgi:hypothetical protein
MKFIIIRISLCVIVVQSIVNLTFAQEEHWIKKDSLFTYVQPVASLQLWSVYSMGEQAQLTDNGPLEAVQDRVNFLTRRARIGFKGRPYKKFNYTLTIQYDNLGKDKLAAVRGGTNTGQLGILDAYATWGISKSEVLNITVGYFHPQFSRECITGDLLVNSFDKAMTQGYIRNHIVGKNYGRSTGLNVGGLLKAGAIRLNYNFAIFNNNTSSDVSESTGKYWSPVLVDRVSITLGDAEMESYRINYDANNAFNKRNGITIGFNNSSQGRTDIFNTNRATGADILINFHNLTLDGEYVLMHRNSEGLTAKSSASHVRVGYNIIVGHKFFLEPVFMYANYEGDENAKDVGEDNQYDFGLNWYLNKKNCKLSLHYIQQNGQGDNGFTDGVTFRKGNLLALGFVVLL